MTSTRSNESLAVVAQPSQQSVSKAMQVVDIERVHHQVACVKHAKLPSSSVISNNPKDKMDLNHDLSKSEDFPEMDDVITAVKELIVPVMMSGLGNLGAGLMLNKVQYWEVFTVVPQLIALVPALLGLKGNVEMTLSSRLTTHAHLGSLDNKESRRKIMLGNIALAQAQASGVGMIAPLIALAISYFQGNLASPIPEHRINWPKSLLTISSSVVTSGLADLLLASTMSGIILLTYLYCKVDVDNIATPIAASLGDLVTMAFFTGLSVGLYSLYKVPSLHYLLAVPTLIYMAICIWTSYTAFKNPYVSKQIIFGWNPLIVSMLLQNLSGMVMERFIRAFPRMAVFQPIINGFGGNLVAIQSSRVATHLHKTSSVSGSEKDLACSKESCCSLPWVFFFGRGKHGKLASILVMIAAPLQLPFIILAATLSGSAFLTPWFFLTYYAASTLQVIIILYVGYCFINLLWMVGVNPDNSSIPILTALADLLGCVLLAISFLFLEALDDPNAIPTQVSIERHFNSTVF